MSASPLADLVAVILAGGLGTRVRHLLPGLPKPMAPVAGRPFLEWVVRFLAKQGIRCVVISSGYRADVVETHFRERAVGSVQIQTVAEPEPLGTAGGWVHAARLSGQQPRAWLVLNGDSLVFAALSQLDDAIQRPNSAGAILGLAVPDASRYGSLAYDSDGRLLRFAEKKAGRGVVSAGVYLLPATALGQVPGRRPLSFENDLFPAWLEAGARIQVVECDAPFLDIGTEQSLPQAESFVRQHADQFWGD